MNTVDRTSNESVPRLVNPALLEHAKQRRQSLENRVADHITAFSGSMRFVYLHMIWFTCWIAFGVEPYPYGLLTMIVSLEAIFLSTFVMISQNRADAKREVLANQQWSTVKDEDQQNQQLLQLSHQILALTKAVHASLALPANDAAANVRGAAAQSEAAEIGPSAENTPPLPDSSEPPQRAATPDAPPPGSTPARG
jgi:uncharacterized membrane protein